MAGSTVSKSVSLRIVANAGTAKQTLDEITEKADQINEKRSSLTVNVKGSELATADLDGIRLKADELGLKNVKINIKAEGAEKTAADLEKDKLEADALHKSVGSAALGITGFSDVTGAASADASMFSRVMAGLSAATGVLEPLMAGVVVATGAMASGFAAAGAGLGVFGLVAYKAIDQAATSTKKLHGSMGVLQEDIKKAKSEFNGWISGAESGVAGSLLPAFGMLSTVFKDMNEFLKPMETAVHSVVEDLSTNFKSSFIQGFVADLAKNSGPAFQKIAIAIGDITKGLIGILKAFMPMSQGILGGLDKLTAKFATWGETLSGHSGFQALMSMFKTETPLAIKVIENLGKSIKGIVGAMTGLDGIGNSKTLLQVLVPLTGLIAKLADGNPVIDRTVLYMLAAVDAGKKLGNVFKSVQAGYQGFQQLTSFIQAAAVKMGFLKAATEEETVATGEAAEAQEGLDIALDANVIGIIVIAIAALVVAFVELWKHCASFRDFWKDAWKDIEGAAVAAWHFIDNDMIHPFENGIGSLVSWVKSHWKLLATIIATVLLGPIGGLITFVATHWSEFTRLTSELASDVERIFRTMVSNIVRPFEDAGSWLVNAGGNIIRGLGNGIDNLLGSFYQILVHVGDNIINMFSNAGSWLYNAGINIIEGLWNGFSSMAGGFLKSVENFGSNIGRSFMSALGIHSPSTVFKQHGQMIVAGLVQGLNGSTSLATTAVTNLGHAVSNAMSDTLNRNGAMNLNLHGAASGSQQQVNNINITGLVTDPNGVARQIAQLLNDYNRENGKAQVFA